MANAKAKTKTKARSSSTETASPRAAARIDWCPGALRLSQLAKGAPPHTFEAWGVSPKSASRMDEVVRRMRDPEAVRQRLLAAPPLALVLLEALVEAGGLASYPTLAGLMSERAGADVETVRDLSLSLDTTGLAVRVTLSSEVGPFGLCVLHELAPELGPRVYGLSAPTGVAPPAAASAVARPPDGLAAVLAVAGLAQHKALRCTRDGHLHRANGKKLARELSLDLTALEALVERALELGALVPGATEGRFDVSPARMRAAAEGRYAEPMSIDGLLQTWLAEGPRSTELVVRALARDGAEAAGSLTRPWAAQPYGATLAQARERLASSPSCARLESDGVEWLTPVAPRDGLPDEVEGFVTPSLEVMVGPEPDPCIVARLALAAELVRVDRVLTFRLRPETVQRGAATGIDGPGLVDVLSRIGRHPLPDSVRAQVLDWSDNARCARSTPMSVLRVPLRMHDEAVSALRSAGVEVLGPGVLGAPESVSFETLRARLERAGIELAGRAVEAEEEEALDELLSLDPEDLEPPLPLIATPDPELARRVTEDRAGGWATSLAAVRAPFQHASGDPWKALRELRQKVSPLTRRGIEAMIKTHERIRTEVDAWIASQPPDERRGLESALLEPQRMLPLLMIAPLHRRRLLGAGGPLEQLESALLQTMARGLLSPEGRKIRRALEKPELPAILDEIFFGGEDDDSYDEDDEDDEDEVPSPPPAQTRDAMLALLRDHVGAEAPLRLWWTANGTASQEVAWIDQLRIRGREPVLLITEVESESSRVLLLDTVQAASPL